MKYMCAESWTGAYAQLRMLLGRLHDPMMRQEARVILYGLHRTLGEKSAYGGTTSASLSCSSMNPEFLMHFQCNYCDVVKIESHVSIMSRSHFIFRTSFDIHVYIMHAQHVSFVQFNCCIFSWNYASDQGSIWLQGGAKAQVHNHVFR